MLFQQRVREHVLSGRFLRIVNLRARCQAHDADPVVAGEKLQVVDSLKRLFAVLIKQPLHLFPVVHGHGIRFYKP